MSKFKVGDHINLHYVATAYGSKVPKIVIVEDVIGTKGNYYYKLKGTEYTFWEGSTQEVLSELYIPQITVGSKWREKNGSGNGFVAEIVSVDEDRLTYDSNHYPNTICPYNLNEWFKYMEPVPESETDMTKSIITETIVKSVKAGVYGGLRVKFNTTIGDHAYLGFEHDTFTKQTLGDLIETLKQIHEVM